MIAVCGASLSLDRDVVRRPRRRAPALSRGTTLVEVLIVVAIMALIAGSATLLVIPAWERSRVRMAIVGAGTIKEAVKMHLTMAPGADADGCPTVGTLVAERQLEKGKTEDPWGSEYKIVCDEGEIHVISPGPDKKENTPDDVRDDLRPEDVQKVKK